MMTPLYQRTIARYQSEPELNDLMFKVWSPTPWMVDAFTGRICEDRDHQMRAWCHEQFGDECSPILGKTGTWQRGYATINGWTWFGFASEEQMASFCDAWPSSEAPRP